MGIKCGCDQKRFTTILLAKTLVDRACANKH
jgi:hypothetical protein